MLSSFISETTDATPTKLDTLYEYVLEKVLKHFEHAPPTHSAYRAIFLPCGQAFRDVTMSDNYMSQCPTITYMSQCPTTPQKLEDIPEASKRGP